MDNHMVPAEHSARPSAWHSALLTAEHPEAVVNTVKDYLVLCTPTELAQLPEGCTSEQFSQPEDVKQIARKFTYESTKREASTRRVVGEFIAAAASRISELEQKRY